MRKNNYVHWKFRMEYILDNKGLLEVVLGSEMRPDTSANDQQIWDKKDKEARQLIVMCVNEDQDNYLYGAKTASEMWAKLSSVYQEKHRELASIEVQVLFPEKGHRRLYDSTY